MDEEKKTTEDAKLENKRSSQYREAVKAELERLDIEEAKRDAQAQFKSNISFECKIADLEQERLRLKELLAQSQDRARKAEAELQTAKKKEEDLYQSRLKTGATRKETDTSTKSSVGDKFKLIETERILEQRGKELKEANEKVSNMELQKKEISDKLEIQMKELAKSETIMTALLMYSMVATLLALFAFMSA